MMSQKAQYKGNLGCSCVPAHSCDLRLVDHWKYNLNPYNDHHRADHFDLVSSALFSILATFSSPELAWPGVRTRILITPRATTSAQTCTASTWTPTPS